MLGRHKRLKQIGHWNPGLTQNIPWSAFLALLLVLLSVAASVVVLVLSDGVSVEEWEADGRQRPAVYLAIFSAIEGMLLKYALGECRIISWWTLALKGSTISGLQSNGNMATVFTEYWTLEIISLSWEWHRSWCS